MTETANGALSYDTTGDGLLNLYFALVRGLAEERLHALLEDAWAESPLSTLKILFNLRDCRGGKGEKQLFFLAMRWLHKKDEEIFYKNWDWIPFYGSWKDYLVLGIDPSRIASTFALQLATDAEELKSGVRDAKISLCAKWAPTEGHALDKGMVDAIAKRLETDRRGYRKNYIVPMRKHIGVVETLLTAKHLEEIDFSKVPAYAMKMYKKAFVRAPHFHDYLDGLKNGTEKVNARILHPHEVLKDVLTLGKSDPLLEAQWSTLVEDARSHLRGGILHNALCLVDVSGSMSTFAGNVVPLHVAMAMGLLLSSISTGAFAKRFLTFTDTCTMETVKGRTLFDQISNMSNAEWGGSTNLQNAFTRILSFGLENEVPSEEMPKLLLILSDMQFDQACPTNTLTNLEEIEKKYADAGYERPTLLFWNLSATGVDFPTTSTVPNAVLLSGFSTSVLSTLTSGKIPTPRGVLMNIISSPRYDRLSV